MTRAVDAAKTCAAAFIDAFNAQNHEALAETLNYPHIRLANGRFATVESGQSFIERSRTGKAFLEKEGWHHTTVVSNEVVHEGPDKVHLAIRNHRCHEDGTVYNTFNTLWIVTRIEGHWGIQFRSSYLR